ncbi:MAG: class I SAM-dependent methyltransferase, partial [Candidatus Omnitrophota bacterium]
RIVNELKPGAQTKILSLCALDLTNEIFLAKQGSQVLAIGNNLNERQADIEKYSNLTAINGDIRTEVEKLKGYFDIIIVENGLHYLDRSDLEKVFKHISRLLVQEKGHLCFVVRSKKDWQYLETIDRGETEDSFSWLTKYYDSQVNKYFSRQFFDKKRIEYYLELKGVSLKLKELSEVEQPLSQTVDLSLGEDRKPFVLLEGIIVKLPLTRKKISQRIDEGVNNVDEVLTTEEKRKKGSLKDIIATLIKTAANILRQENTSVNTFLIVQDECFVKEADASRNAELAGIVSKVGRVFGHKRGNHVHICKSYQSAKEKLDKISNVDWKNTFLYVDSRVDDKEVWDQDECNAKKVFDGFIKVELKTGLDGSILMAAPISGYAAYSQVYSDLIERIEILCKEEESVVITQHIVSLVKAMAIIQKTIVQSDDSVETIENEIMKISDGIIKIANEIDSKNKMDLIKDFLKEYRKQHVWDLPYIKAIDWQEVVKRVKLEEKTIYFL